ncbi:cupin domain-containing protein [Bacteroidota bacterium]|jgi:mannose-6-phosphate isomerase-like protein (cupin superfamily)|nr:cupin domain-containing protein [Balneolaceae bacterium]MDC3136707.1 cupin domain-containing protein [Bacteroidota bacterium]
MLQENKNVVNFNEKLKLIKTYWSPKIVASLNDYHFKLVKVKGDFIWHNHQDTDEAFIVLSGELRIDYRDHSITLREGEMHVVKKGIDHKPYAENECSILLIEPLETINTGAILDQKTAKAEWI